MIRQPLPGREFFARRKTFSVQRNLKLRIELRQFASLAEQQKGRRGLTTRIQSRESTLERGNRSRLPRVWAICRRGETGRMGRYLPLAGTRRRPAWAERRVKDPLLWAVSEAPLPDFG
jgi:hypothetical protein